MGKNEITIILIIFNIILLAFIVGIIIFIHQYRLKRKMHIQELKEIDHLHKKEILHTQFEIQNQTMKSIGREIHDNVGQKLTLSSLYLHGLNKEGVSQEYIEKTNEVIHLITESLEDLRNLSRSLTDDHIQKKPLKELIEIELERINKFEKITVHFKSNGNIKLKSYSKKAILLRIIQEFLQNSLKHSNCKNIYINIDKINNEWVLKLKDDGIGFNPKLINSSGIGLKNMKKRLELINGTFSLFSETGKGTIIEVKIS